MHCKISLRVNSVACHTELAIAVLDKPLQYIMQETPAESLMVRILAEDGGTPMMSTSHILTLQLDDINEFSPKFDQASYQTSAQNTAASGTYLIQVTATDGDGRDNTIDYSIVPDDFSGNFTIDMNGVIRNTRRLQSQVSYCYRVAS